MNSCIVEGNCIMIEKVLMTSLGSSRYSLLSKCRDATHGKQFVFPLINVNLTTVFLFILHILISNSLTTFSLKAQPSQHNYEHSAHYKPITLLCAGYACYMPVMPVMPVICILHACCMPLVYMYMYIQVYSGVCIRDHVPNFITNTGIPIHINT